MLHICEANAFAVSYRLHVKSGRSSGATLATDSSPAARQIARCRDSYSTFSEFLADPWTFVLLDWDALTFCRADVRTALPIADGPSDDAFSTVALPTAAELVDCEPPWSSVEFGSPLARRPEEELFPGGRAAEMFPDCEEFPLLDAETRAEEAWELRAPV
mmetsp:Transcript_1976/g.5912  ORF Transcript_1976/g.5912 Transcript_1976/m.5912 type:complete len:160 (+) Transcript_1976:197-676(+)